MRVSEEHTRRKGACAWCGRANIPRRYAVYERNGETYAAYLCDRCLMEYQRGIEYEKRQEEKADDDQG